MNTLPTSQRAKRSTLLCLVLLAGGWTRGCPEEMAIPEKPLLNDLKCLALSPYYVPKNVAGAWVGAQMEMASFLDSTATHSSGRKISALEKIGWAIFVMPVHAVASFPVCAVSAGVVPVAGHVLELFTLPFGRPLRFPRLDGAHWSNDK